MKKRTSGRPKLPGKRVKFNTTLPQDIVDTLRVLGIGNASHGITWLTERFVRKEPQWAQQHASGTWKRLQAEDARKTQSNQ